MFTLDEIKEILDADDATTLDGYNLIRTNLMTKLSPAITEVESLNSQIKNLTEENDRLKQANATLYSKIEGQILGKPADKNERSGDPDATEDDLDEKTPAEVLEENVSAYMED
ncbi:MAG: hypothetical protein J6N15_00800 [Ruminiclostridium sp.]|nr:hypothetical protein [Ruminiclostridium sp.]